MDQKNNVGRVARCIFAALAVGTLPVLFISPGQYIFGLLVCALIAYSLAVILV